jgi:hypothetical protein
MAAISSCDPEMQESAWQRGASMYEEASPRSMVLRMRRAERVNRFATPGVTSLESKRMYF